jgi:hypothetical protein
MSEFQIICAYICVTAVLASYVLRFVITAGLTVSNEIMVALIGFTGWRLAGLLLFYICRGVAIVALLLVVWGFV